MADREERAAQRQLGPELLHLKQRPGDGWDIPAGSTDTDCHLMVQCMETWFLADHPVLSAFFNPGFRSNDLPAAVNPTESVAKADVYNALKLATRECKRNASYGKGAHSFKLLAAIEPTKVMAASPWAKRFIECLKAKMN